MRVDDNTWPRNVAPPNIKALSGLRQVDLIEFLLMIGYCTVPAHAARHSINSLWAWVRYFGAISQDQDLRLGADFSELDPHQKTILSDDFGMGISLQLLASALDLTEFCDGKYFIDRVAPRVRCHVAATGAKRGPRKSPDFVAIDSSGRYHVIECKGTQSGLAYAERQLADAYPQKEAISFDASITGESLATGFSISAESNTHSSTFIITDPEPKAPQLRIDDDEEKIAHDAIARGKISRILTLAGANSLARIVAAPYGDRPSATPDVIISKRQMERERQLREQVDEEQSMLTPSPEGYGRMANIDLPFPIITEKGRFTKVKISSTIQKDAFDEWFEISKSDAPRSDELTGALSAAAKGKIISESDGTSGELRDGQLFSSHLELVK
ncbi:hypothetical protein M2324_001957 [Rhodovulum sulfidophilum]|uniref:hypothetical protein n=1 Tax=Rhodovulum sulfidophilum TaxID=35806 RepID=UPI001E5CFE83|nr:hypothetical protein [Rhodovulum sulfidophilum]MCW2303560.1 hypothetical protein [Rhodovulum sulfidophilum]